MLLRVAGSGSPPKPNQVTQPKLLNQVSGLHLSQAYDVHAVFIPEVAVDLNGEVSTHPKPLLHP